MSDESFTCSDAPKINVEDIIIKGKKIETEMLHSLIESFRGIPVRVDYELSGYEYYICISPQLKLHLLEKQTGFLAGPCGRSSRPVEQ